MEEGTDEGEEQAEGQGQTRGTEAENCGGQVEGHEEAWQAAADAGG